MTRPEVGGRPRKIANPRSIRTRLDEEEVLALDVLADIRDVSRNDLIRQAVTDLLTTAPEENA